ncbi:MULTISPECIES: ArsR/SmtB family transcription factor [Cellulosimicrobium]|uniref:Metalloregulator ArsR/SmtB family transcription factor n=1 Tax=Cellulosimicrobium composti TaxID=2672572 RepID=A0A6N7ZP11_9MICO|nr:MULTISPECIES: metalloregulator ArsR/SmtB family transcription factor [Cellulosimicrobium]MTG90918.1 metalloregulator ArsR/SmtB family transcription factor [Cellulosimicrobium composti]QUC02010.1 winged helix-turn-helix transcriptional regulator [Cellulosimicrobium cellulans]
MLNTGDRVEVMGRLGRAMSDPTRARILERLLVGPAYPADLADALGLSRQNVSNHLACLRGCGLVLAEPDGRRTQYTIADPHLSAALDELMRVVLDVREGRECSNPVCDVPGCTACEDEQ